MVKTRRQKAAAEKKPFVELKVGQVWMSLDRRDTPLPLTIIRFEELSHGRFDGRYVVLVKGDPSNERVSRVRVDQFRRRFFLAKPAPEDQGMPEEELERKSRA